MVYTEYFAKGTQPTTSCEIHASRGIFGSIAAVFTGGSEKDTATHAVPRLEDTAPPITTAALDVPAADTSHPSGEPAKKKRGFWSRVFGVGHDDSNNQRVGTRPER
jgi:hypothetical protein